jgi:hypothetical protein
VTIVEALTSLTLMDVILIGSAAIFFSTVGAFAGILRKRAILWAGILALALLGLVYQEELYFQWLIFSRDYL